MALMWDKTFGIEFTDVPGLGRYSIRREAKGSRNFSAFLNNERTTYTGTVEEVKKAVERAVNQWRMPK